MAKTKSLTDVQKRLKDAIGDKDFNKFKSMIDSIETSMPTTKNHYGRYMALLSKFPADKRLVYANFFIVMGGNRQGISDALSIVGHKKKLRKLM